MTTREIAEAAGVSTDTVARKGRELFPGRYSKGKRTELSQSEAVAVMKELRKVNFVELPQSAVEAPQSAEVVTRGDLAAFGAAIVSEMMKQFLPMFHGAKPATAQIEAPPLATRDELRRIVARAGQASGDFRGAWGTLYQEIYYRLHRNVKECAKNRGMDTLDYVEEEGLLPDAVAIAREVFK